MIAWRTICRYILLSLIIGFSCVKYAKAGHASGGYLTVKYSGTGNTYQIKYVFYRDCSGIPAPINPQVDYWASGLAVSNINLINTSVTVPVGTCLPSNGISCISYFGVIEEYIYTGNVNLIPNNIYYFKFIEGFLTQITTISGVIGNGSYDLISEAMINLQAVAGNSLPDFNAQSQFYFCLNQYINYNNSVTDINNDSIVYSLVPINGNAANSISYSPPFSYLSFISSSSPIYFDSLTGFVSFIPNNIQNGWIEVKVDEYRNGILIGSIRRGTVMRIVNGTVVVPEFKDAETIVVFPNPTADILHFQNKQKLNIYQWVITDASGRILKSGNETGNDFAQTITVNELSRGIYFLQIVNGDGMTAGKFVKE